MDTRTLSLLWNTLFLCGCTCALSVPLGTLLAWLLVRTDLPGRKLGIGLLAAMLFVPLYLQAAAWQAGFGLQGWYTLAGSASVLLDGWRGAGWVHSMAAVPWVVLIAGFGFAKVEVELEEQAALDGSTPQVFWHVTLRSALPAVGAAALWVALTTAGEMTVTDLFAVRTYAEEVYTQLAIGQEPSVAPLAVLPGVAITAIFVIAGLALCRGLAPRDRALSLEHRPWTFRLGRWRIAWLVAAVMLLVLLVGVPLGNLLYKAGVVVTQTDGQRLRAFSPGKCVEMIAAGPWHCRREFGWSLLLCASAAVAAVAIAIPLAWLARRGGIKAAPALLVTAMGVAVPGPVLGLAIITLLNRPELPWLAQLYDRSILAPFLALLVRRPAAGDLRAVARAAQCSARDARLGGGRWSGPCGATVARGDPLALAGRGFGALGVGSGGAGRSGRQHLGRAAGRDHAFDPHLRPAALRSGRPGGRHLLGIARRVRAACRRRDDAGKWLESPPIGRIIGTTPPGRNCHRV